MKRAFGKYAPLDIDPVEIDYDCKICKDHKVMECNQRESLFYKEDFDTQEVKFYKDCDCVIAERNKYRFEKAIVKSNLEEIYKEIKNQEYETKFYWQKEYLNKMRAFVKSSDRGLIISGQTGSGKSLLLGKALANLMHLGRDCHYMQWGQGMKKLVNQYNKVGAEEELFFNRLCTVEVLYIDDLFKTEGNDINKLPNKTIHINMLWEIINKRMYVDGMKTIISTELFEEDFNNLDKSTRGRLLQLTERKENWIQMNKQEERDIRVMKFNGEF